MFDVYAFAMVWLLLCLSHSLTDVAIIIKVKLKKQCRFLHLIKSTHPTSPSGTSQYMYSSFPVSPLCGYAVQTVSVKKKWWP